MPQLADLDRMQLRMIYAWLCTIPTSRYSGYNIERLLKKISKNKARQHLVELILLNDREKSKLHAITEKSDDVVSSSNSSVNQPHSIRLGTISVSVGQMNDDS